MVGTTSDPNNFSRLTVALERWIRTGEILVACIEKTGDTANVQRVRALKDNVQLIQQLVAQLRG
jgi:hypothetical protein